MDPTFLTEDQVLYLHELLIEEHGGSFGLRDQGLLESALGMPQAGFDGAYFHETVFEMAAAYLFHLVKNHPFVDGNKRIGWACAAVFLGLNDLKLTLSNNEAVALTMRVASETISKLEISKVRNESS